MVLAVWSVAFGLWVWPDDIRFRVLATTLIVFAPVMLAVEVYFDRKRQGLEKKIEDWQGI